MKKVFKAGEQGRVFLSPPHMGGQELQFVREAIESNYIAPLGPQVDAFEREFADKLGIAHAVALSSGTAAMHLALRILDVGPGDEVIASTLTFIGSVTPIVFQGATPVFVDADRATWNMDPDLLDQEIKVCAKRGKLPKAVVPTDLYGQCADLGRILEICEPYGIPVVSDSAEALGAEYLTQSRKAAGGEIQKEGSFFGALGGLARGEFLHAGKGANAAVFSFNGNKIITTSGGGVLASDDGGLIEQARFLSQQARDPAPHYEHTTIGYNYRMSNVLAALGRAQLRVLEDRVRRRREIFEYYRKGLEELPGIGFMPEAAYGKSNRWLTIVVITPEEFGADRETVRLALDAEDIEARPVWKPMHMQPVFDELRDAEQGLRLKEGKNRDKIKARAVGGEVAEDLFNRGLCLPSGTAMTDSDLDRIISIIRTCRK